MDDQLVSTSSYLAYHGDVVSEYPVKVSVTGAIRRLATDLVRRTARAALPALLAVSALVGSVSFAAAENRSLKLFFTHTGERANITYKRNGKFDPKGLNQVNRLLRDWRKNEPAKMDPRLLDLVWEVYDRSGAKDYIHVVSAYRSPATNNMLRNRSRSSGVAKSSQHTLGKAMDFFIPGVKLATLRSLAMQMQVGGVGYYPTSGSPFVHLDVGNVRAWPRMSQQELARIFPNGRTMHIPSNGKPLPGYGQAVADYKRRVGSKSIEIASTAGDEEDTGTKASGRSLVTAMLPTPRSSALDALKRQTSPNVADNEDAESEISELAAIAIPVPTFRPSSPVPPDAVQTASIGPVPALESLKNQRPQGAQITIRQTMHSIASLPLTAPLMVWDEDGDSQEAFLDWALSSSRNGNGMTAPTPVLRTLTNTAVAMDTGTTLAPVATTEEFGSKRVWSDG